MFLAPFLLLLKNSPLEKHQLYLLCAPWPVSSPFCASLSSVKWWDCVWSPKIHSSVAFRPSGGRGVETQVCCFCAKDKAWHNQHTHLFLDPDTSSCNFWLAPRAPHARQLFSILPFSGMRKMVLVLETCRILRGPNTSRATCFFKSPGNSSGATGMASTANKTIHQEPLSIYGWLLWLPNRWTYMELYFPLSLSSF